MFIYIYLCKLKVLLSIYTISGDITTTAVADRQKSIWYSKPRQGKPGRSKSNATPPQNLHAGFTKDAKTSGPTKSLSSIAEKTGIPLQMK